MKSLILILSLLWTCTLFGQKIISYKFEKEVSGKRIWGGRVVSTSKAVDKKVMETIFIFDSLSKKVKIGDIKWEILRNDADNFILYRNGSNAELHLLPNWDDDKRKDSEILLEFDNGTRIRYYFKSLKWVQPNFQFVILKKSNFSVVYRFCFQDIFELNTKYLNSLKYLTLIQQKFIPLVLIVVQKLWVAYN